MVSTHPHTPARLSLPFPGTRPGSASHTLHTPLGLLLFNLQTLVDGLQDDP